MATTLTAAVVTADVTYDGTNPDDVIDALPHGVVADRTNGTLLISCDPLDPAHKESVNPGDHVIVTAADGRPFIAVLTALQWADLVTVV